MPTSELYVHVFFTREKIDPFELGDVDRGANPEILSQATNIKADIVYEHHKGESPNFDVESPTPGPGSPSYVEASMPVNDVLFLDTAIRTARKAALESLEVVLLQECGGE